MTNQTFDKYIIRAILIIIGINFIDFIITVYALETGDFTELNPIARFNMERFGYFVAFIFNMLYTIIIVPSIFHLGKFCHTKFEKRKYTNKTIKTHYRAIIFTFLIVEVIIILHNINLLLEII